MKIVAFLPAKGTSDRIASKNMKLLNGKPLFLHTLEKLVMCNFIDEVYLDSESDEILNYARYLNYTPLKRDPRLATNQTDGNQMFYNEVLQVEADIYIQILGTSPFITPDTIKKGVDILLQNEQYDSVVLMKREKQYMWENGRPLYDRFHIPNSNTLPDTMIESMGLYIVRREIVLRDKTRYGNHVYMLTADAIETIDVNYPDEFDLAECIMRGIKEKENTRFRFLSKFLSSAILSDVLFDLGINATIFGLTPNLPEKKIMGRANTLKIRRLMPGEDYRGIYAGLKTYQRMSSGEIIVVENEVADRAYFGELNANLAIRAGAIGTIISGVTRDSAALDHLDYPVFAKGYFSADVKGCATVEAHQCEIQIDGINIKPGDLIFADREAVVCIPQYMEAEVLERAITAARIEKNVLKRVLNNEDAESIYQLEGEF